MQLGPEGDEVLENTSQSEVEESIEDFIEEVFNEKFDNFRAYFEKTKETLLYLDDSHDLSSKKLGLLSKALQGTQVTHVLLHGNDIDCQGAIDFAENLPGTNITTIDLRTNYIGAKGAKVLAQKLHGTQVTSISLVDNEIGPEGAKDFAEGLQGTHVTWVDLSGNDIGDDGVKVFAQSLLGTNVISVMLRSNNISPEGAKDFAVGLRGTAVTTVDLSGNPIGIEGTQNFILNLQGTNVITVGLRRAGIGFRDPENSGLMLQATSVTGIDLSNNNLGNDVTRIMLQDTNVRTVILSDNSIYHNSAGDFVKTLAGTKVTRVDLSLNRLGDQGLVYLMKSLESTKVRYLRLLRDTTLTLAGIQEMIPLISKTYLTFVEVPFDVQALLTALAKNSFQKYMAAQLMFCSMRDMKVALSHQKKYADCQNSEEQLWFIWEILQALPQDLRNKIVDGANDETGFKSGKAITHFFHALRQPLEITLKASTSSTEKRSLPNNEEKKPRKIVKSG